MYDTEFDDRPLSAMSMISMIGGIVSLVGPTILYFVNLTAMMRNPYGGRPDLDISMMLLIILVSLAGGVSAVVLGHLGIPATRAGGGQKGWSLAIAGLIMGYLFLTLVLVVLAVLLFQMLVAMIVRPF